MDGGWSGWGGEEGEWVGRGEEGGVCVGGGGGRREEGGGGGGKVKWDGWRISIAFRTQKSDMISSLYNNYIHVSVTALVANVSNNGCLLFGRAVVQTSWHQLHTHTCTHFAEMAKQ